jgi:hypothetical protein
VEVADLVHVGQPQHLQQQAAPPDELFRIGLK